MLLAPKGGRAVAQTCLRDAGEPAGPHQGMVWIPGGSFEMGDTVYAEEGGKRRVTVAGFWMDRHEVTNREFAAFVEATHYVTIAERALDAATHPGLDPALLKAGALVFVMPREVHGLDDVNQWWKYVPGANWRRPGGPQTSIEGRADFPVVELAYADVQAYAQWKGRTLPSEAQWEWAARGGAPSQPDHEQPRDANTWQGVFPVADSGDDGFVGLAPVGCFKANAFGLFDMIGNVWEWTDDRYEPAPNQSRGVEDMPERSAVPGHVIKGGSFLCAANYCMRYRAGARQNQEDDLAVSHLGFRTILVPAQR
jgi:formylglycine-generating enzyme required for sulfatase activity